MKLKGGFELYKIADEWVVVPLGGNMLKVNGILTLSESGAFLWNKLLNGTDVNELVTVLLSEYNIDRDSAETDVNRFIEDLKRLDLLTDF